MISYGKDENKIYKGNYCVYLMHGVLPIITYAGSMKECEQYIAEYNRSSPEHYRCNQVIGLTKEIAAKRQELSEKYSGHAEECECLESSQEI